jgi:hypothetical protein
MNNNTKIKQYDTEKPTKPTKMIQTVQDPVTVTEKERQVLIEQRAGTTKPENAREYWPKEAQEALERMYLGEGEGISKIALFFGRSELSIYQQLIKRGLMGNQSSSTGSGGSSPRCLCDKCKIKECPNHKEPYASI